MYYTHILYHTIQTSWTHMSSFLRGVRKSHICFRNVHPKPIRYGYVHWIGLQAVIHYHT